MNKQVMLMGGLGFLLVVGVVLYMVWPINNSPDADSSVPVDPNSYLNKVESKDEETDEPVIGSGQFASIMELNGSLECDFNSLSDDENISGGIFYYQDDKFKIEMITVSQSGEFAMNILNDGVSTYTWGETPFGDQAFKFDNASMVSPSPEGDVTYQSVGTFDMGQLVEYECRRTAIDESVFLLPPEVEFGSLEDFTSESVDFIPESGETSSDLSDQ